MTWYRVFKVKTIYGYPSFSREYGTYDRKDAFTYAEELAEAELVKVEIEAERPLGGGRGLTSTFWHYDPKAEREWIKH